MIAWLQNRRQIPDPPLTAQRDIVLDHYEEMLVHYGIAIGSRIARKHVAWYSKGLPGSAEFRAGMMRLTDPTEVQRLIDHFYDPLIAAGAARTHTRDILAEAA